MALQTEPKQVTDLALAMSTVGKTFVEVMREDYVGEQQFGDFDLHDRASLRTSLDPAEVIHGRVA